MNPFTRWIRFNLVGALGSVVQLASLAAFSRWMHTHYLLAAAAALEMTLLHNFLWHCNYTWRDRQMLDTRGRMFVRYHLSSGVVSMLGNLAMMRLLVQQAHLPVLVADVDAILCCSILNFFAGNSWAFAPTQAASAKRE